MVMCVTKNKNVIKKKLKERQTDMNKIFTKVLGKSCCHMVSVTKQDSQIEQNHMMKETVLRISHRSNIESESVVANLRLTPKLLLLSILLAMGNAAWATQGDNHQGQGQGHESHGNGNGYGHGSHDMVTDMEMVTDMDTVLELQVLWDQ